MSNVKNSVYVGHIPGVSTGDVMIGDVIGDLSMSLRLSPHTHIHKRKHTRTYTHQCLVVGKSRQLSLLPSVTRNEQ